MATPRNYHPCRIHLQSFVFFIYGHASFVQILHFLHPEAASFIHFVRRPRRANPSKGCTEVENQQHTVVASKAVVAAGSRSLLLICLHTHSVLAFLSHGEGGARRKEQDAQGVAHVGAQEGQDRHALRLHSAHHLHRHEHRPQAPALATPQPRLGDGGRIVYQFVVAGSGETRRRSLSRGLEIPIREVKP